MDKLTVVHHNDLIESSYRLDIDEMRLLNLALTKIDSRKSNVGIIAIYPKEFAEMFGLKKKNIWRNMKKALLSIMQKPVKLRFKDKKGKLKEKVIAWLGATTYFVDQDHGAKIELEFTTQITPYLFELQGNFTKINFEYASKLNTPFSFRLYQWLTREYKIKKGQYYDLTLSIDDIKRNAGLDNVYPTWMNFKKRIIQPSIDAINQKTNLSVIYNVKKQGKKAHSITFTYIDEIVKATKSLEKGDTVELSNNKPIRPRLLRRPKVKKGSNAEGEWKMANLRLVSQYQKDLRNWDSTANLTIPDLKKLIEYSQLFATEIHSVAVDELNKRKKITM
jgi:plasmid replication initiation protein